VIALATIQVILDSSWCVGLVLAASRARRWLTRLSVRRRIERALGAVLVGLGLELGIDMR
jgi:threonine/homoserine/homoserine lactone efflux protein